MADLIEILTNARTMNVSDIFIVAGHPVSFKVNGIRQLL